MPPAGQMEQGAWTRLAQLWEDTWDRVPGSKRIFLALFLLGMLATLLAGLINGMLYQFLVGAGFIDENSATTIVDTLYRLIAAVLIAAVTTPFTVALAAAGLERARGNRIGMDLLTRYRDLLPRLLVVVLIFMLLDYLLGLLFAPLALELPLFGESFPPVSFWLLGGLMEALRLLVIINVLDWNASAVEAIGAALRLVVARPLLIAVYLLLSAVFTALIGVTFGLAAIWLLPFLQIGLALVYLRYDEGAKVGAGGATVSS